MSVDAIRWAYRQKTGSASAKSVLVAIADHAGTDLTCYPSLDRLVEKTELSRNTVKAAIDRLEELGLVRVLSVGRRGQATVYRVMATAEDTGQPLTPKPEVTGQINQQLRVNHCPPTIKDNNLIYNNIRDPGKGSAIDPEFPVDLPVALVPIRPESVRKPARGQRSRDYTDDFEDFWRLYPRKDNKPRAFEVWNRVMDRGISPDTVLACLERVCLGEWKGRDVQYIKHPTTWLNSDPWDNEPGGLAKPNGLQQNADLFGR